MCRWRTRRGPRPRAVFHAQQMPDGQLQRQQQAIRAASRSSPCSSSGCRPCRCGNSRRRRARSARASLAAATRQMYSPSSSPELASRESHGPASSVRRRLTSQTAGFIQTLSLKRVRIHSTRRVIPPKRVGLGTAPCWCGRRTCPSARCTASRSAAARRRARHLPRDLLGMQQVVGVEPLDVVALREATARGCARPARRCSPASRP